MLLSLPCDLKSLMKTWGDPACRRAAQARTWARSLCSARQQVGAGAGRLVLGDKRVFLRKRGARLSALGHSSSAVCPSPHGRLEGGAGGGRACPAAIQEEDWPAVCLRPALRSWGRPLGHSRASLGMSA